jgi:RNA polymerase sigma factor (sigma-70 family)
MNIIQNYITINLYLYEQINFNSLLTKDMSIIPEEFKMDDLLWKRFLAGDDLSFYNLYDRYADQLFKYGSHFLKDKELVKDSIHDLFLELHKYRTKLSETNNVKYYLFRSLRRIIYKAQVKVIPLRVNENEHTPFDLPVFSHEDQLIAEESRQEQFKALNEAMKKLTNRQREGLSLKFEHGYSYPEIAQIMGVSIESARSVTYLALKELRKSLEDKVHFIQLLLFLTRNSFS